MRDVSWRPSQLESHDAEAVPRPRHATAEVSTSEHECPPRPRELIRHALTPLDPRGAGAGRAWPLASSVIGPAGGPVPRRTVDGTTPRRIASMSAAHWSGPAAPSGSPIRALTALTGGGSGRPP